MKSGSPEPKRNAIAESPERSQAAPGSPESASPKKEWSALEQRLAHAESALRQTRRLVGGTLALVLVSAVGALVPTAHSGLWQNDRSTLHAPFRVVDAHGKPLLHLDADANGARLRLFDRAGEPLTVMSATPQGSLLRLSSRGEAGDLQLYTDARGGQMSLSGPGSHSPLVWLGAKEEGGGLGVYDGAGRAVAWVTTAKDRRGLSVGDTAGRPVAWLGAARDGGLAIYDASGKTAAYLTASRKGGSLAIYDPARQKTATLTADTDLGDPWLSGPAVAANRPAHMAAGAEALATAAAHSRSSTERPWLMHRNDMPAARKAQPSGHPGSALLPVPRSASTATVSREAAAPRSKKMAPLSAIGPESEAGPHGLIHPMPTPSLAGRIPVRESTATAASRSRAQKAHSSLKPISATAPPVPAGDPMLHRQLALAPPAQSAAVRPQAARTSSRPLHHADSAAKPHPTTRRHRHIRRHRTRHARHSTRRHWRSVRRRYHRLRSARHSRRGIHRGHWVYRRHSLHRPARRAGTRHHSRRLRRAARANRAQPSAVRPVASQHSVRAPAEDLD